MNIWFTRSNGETPLNNSNSLDYVAGEPPTFPKTEYNYRQKCLADGFARIGWPNTGDLRDANPKRLAPNGYSLQNIETRYKTYLSNFMTIKAGDLILIPADQERGDVHIGIVLTTEKKKVMPYVEPREFAYYYYFDISKGDWYECAHRVNVEWAKNSKYDYAIFSIKEAEGIVWNLAFSQIKNENSIYQLAQKAKLF